jgi:hypothetical protein
MMLGIPRTALLLGLAGLLPFLAGALTVATGFEITSGEGGTNTSPFDVLASGRALLLHYGIIILAFMSGALWGFAARSDQHLPYVLSVLPALWALFATTGPETAALLNLALGFTALLGLDGWFTMRTLAPPWWLRLRLLLTAVVVPCLLVGAFV